MDNYTQSYLRNHCVDFFFMFKKRPIHVLTDGCFIPNGLSDVLTNRKLQHEIALASDDGNNKGYSVNQGYIGVVQRLVEAMDEEYRQYVPTTEQLIESHAYLSQLGFYSYACVWDNEEETRCRFILVSYPYGEYQNFMVDLPICNEEEIRLSDNLEELKWEPYLNVE